MSVTQNVQYFVLILNTILMEGDFLFFNIISKCKKDIVSKKDIVLYFARKK